MEYHKNYSLKPINYFCEYDLIWKTEIFKPIPNYEGDYEVSDLGRIKSLKKNYHKIRILVIDHNGYLRVGLSKNGYKTFKIHKLVSMAFLGHTPCGHNIIVDHKNNIQIDNRLINLQLITPRENASKDKKNKTSNYIGVSFCKQTKKWKSVIVIKNKTITIGRFINEIDAHNAYQNKLKEHEQSKQRYL